ncbi:2-polyprenyl-3-methyl-5-hydroxy-6-metoxy-1,4-benzoquinol methylase [Methanohalophilus levihalophilus]|uniref:class I SAM-dependent methyltransferase n=1 Tax=Methanohalophilus levihalophilus TaxID=1431282 RepID=UPI001AE464E5|nr:class I SAM-dependent methyltransferase [Methanohalophilus levihalophilus]MBP2029958.1 2-polyprenyl-3-methyl-5-hydroxy-6-metoxy-1,4-benzoquinol methylase [Methanohalophilus levihalophilus]
MGSWDSKWEEVYRNQEWGKYPPEELIRFIARNFYNNDFRNDVHILDIGCGTGAETWFLAREGFSAIGIDGSKTAISIAKKRFSDENLSGDFIEGDIEALNFADDFFDAVIDIVAVQHNK